MRTPFGSFGRGEFLGAVVTMGCNSFRELRPGCQYGIDENERPLAAFSRLLAGGDRSELVKTPIPGVSRPLAEAAAVERRRGLLAIGGCPRAHQSGATKIAKLEHRCENENRGNDVGRIMSVPQQARTEDRCTEDDGRRKDEDSESASQQRSNQQAEDDNRIHDTTFTNWSRVLMAAR